MTKQNISWMKSSVITLSSFPVRALVGVLLSLLLLGIAISSSRAAESLNAKYIVPPSSASHDPLTYSIYAAGIVGEPGNPRSLKFHLPEDLIGPDHEVFTLTEVTGISLPGITLFSDGMISASCVEGPLSTSCVLKYSRSYASTISAPAVETFLEQKFRADPALLKVKREQFVAFRGDPEGVVVLFK